MTASYGFERGRVIVLPVRLRHRGQYRVEMALDTGSPLTVIHPDVAGKIGLELRKARVVELVGAVGTVPAPRTMIDSISLFGRTVRNLDVVCHPLHPALGLRGVLGLDFLQHFNIRIDNDSETISFERRGG